MKKRKASLRIVGDRCIWAKCGRKQYKGTVACKAHQKKKMHLTYSRPPIVICDE